VKKPLGQRISSAAQQSTRGAAQSLAQQIKTSAADTLTQVGVPESLANRPPSTAQTIQKEGPQALNPAEIQQKEQQLLSVWRQKLAEIEAEQQRARQEREQQYQAWQQAQAEAMQQTSPSAIESPDQSKRGPLQGAKAILHRKQSKEMGRGAKH